MGIKELNHQMNNTEIHIFEHWCYLESVNDDLNLAESIKTKYDLLFDLDIYKLIVKAFSKNIVLHLNTPELTFEHF